jgi:hypothetical protein
MLRLLCLQALSSEMRARQLARNLAIVQQCLPRCRDRLCACRGRGYPASMEGPAGLGAWSSGLSIGPNLKCTIWQLQCPGVEPS